MNRIVAFFPLACCGVFPAHAETVNCTNLTTLPVTISTQGVYCLKQDVSTAITSGFAIGIATNNVTIDCNGYKLGGLAAGDNTMTAGIYANNRLNITVRNCNVRGFRQGINLAGTGGGHVVENNRFDGNTYIGVHVSGDGSLIRGNLVFATGGSTNLGQGLATTLGIDSRGATNIIDNTVWGTTPMVTATTTTGIGVGDNVDGTVIGNRVSGLGGTSNRAVVLYASADRVRVVNNSLSGASWALDCDDAGGGVAKDNTLESGGGLDGNCLDAGGNFLIP